MRAAHYFLCTNGKRRKGKEEMTLKCLQDWRRYLHVSKMEYFRLPSSWLPSCLLSPSSSKTFFFNLNKSLGSRVYAQLNSMKNWWKMKAVNILGLHFKKFANQSTINTLPTLNPSKTIPKEELISSSHRHHGNRVTAEHRT